MNEIIFKIIAYAPNILFLLVILFLIIKQGEKRLANIYFFYILVALIWWLTFLFIADTTSSYDLAFFSVRIGIFGPLWIPPLFFLFSRVFPNYKKKMNKLGYIAFLPAIIMTSQIFTNYNISSIKINNWGVSANSGPLYIVFAIYFLIMIILAVINFIHKYKRGVSVEKTQIRYVLLGFIITSVGLLISNVVLVNAGVSQYGVFGLFSIWFFVGLTGYAMIRHSLFDIRLTAVRTLAYILSLTTLSLVYYYIAYFVSLIFFHDNVNSSASISPVNIFLALLLAFVFQPIKRFFDKVTNRVFYKDNYNSDDFFARFNKILASTTDLRGLLERAAHEIGQTLKSEQAFFFINTTNGHHMSAGTPNHKQLPKEDAVQLGVAHDNMNRGLIIASLLDVKDPIRRLMLSYRIELVLPLDHDNKSIGYLCLGDHMTSSYTSRDIRVLNTISNELIVAVQNALAVHEIRELNATLQQRIANATKELRVSNTVLRHLDKAKDEFVSMASHQLRTPLTSVKGYISMVIEGDAGKITDSQKGLLDEAFNSSERMVHLINDFLNVSRIQNGKFIIEKHPTDLSKVVGQEIDSLKPSALSRNLKFVYNPPRDFPMIDIDEGKVRQVVINFADNALYYSHENTTINISLSIENNEALFTVKDNGIGVPSDEQEQLFTKFYRASNARKQRPDGTGVGLYLAKKIIDAHDGKIVFESVEGKGSTFGFRLPLQ